MANQRTVHLNAFETTLASSMDSTTSTLVVSAAGALAAPCWLVVDKDDPAKREYVAVTNVAGTTLTVTRYQSGSAAGSGITHDAGATVHLPPTKQSFDDLHDRLEAHDHGNTGTPNSGAVVSHDDLDGLTANQHHAMDHASSHAIGGADPIIPAAMAAEWKLSAQWAPVAADSIVAFGEGSGVPLEAIRNEDSSEDYWSISLATGVVTINTTGWYLVTFNTLVEAIASGGAAVWVISDEASPTFLNALASQAIETDDSNTGISLSFLHYFESGTTFWVDQQCSGSNNMQYAEGATKLAIEFRGT